MSSQALNELKLELPEETITLQEIQQKLEPIKKMCQAMNDKGFKCSRRQKGDGIYCGKHNKDNDHILDDTIQVSIKMINGETYYINKCGVVFSYDIEKPSVIGYIKDNKFMKVIL
jgi:hypothetical protein